LLLARCRSRVRPVLNRSIRPCTPRNQSSNPINDRTDNPESEDVGPKENPKSESPNSIIEAHSSAARSTACQNARGLLPIKIDAVQQSQGRTQSASDPKEIGHAEHFPLGTPLKSPLRDSQILVEESNPAPEHDYPAAKNATGTVPIVMAASGEPVET